MAKLKKKFDDLFGATRSVVGRAGLTRLLFVFQQILQSARSNQHSEVHTSAISEHRESILCRKEHQKVAKDKLHELEVLSAHLEQVMSGEDDAAFIMICM